MEKTLIFDLMYMDEVYIHVEAGRLAIHGISLSDRHIDMGGYYLNLY